MIHPSNTDGGCVIIAVLQPWSISPIDEWCFSITKNKQSSRSNQTQGHTYKGMVLVTDPGYSISSESDEIKQPRETGKSIFYKFILHFIKDQNKNTIYFISVHIDCSVPYFSFFFQSSIKSKNDWTNWKWISCWIFCKYYDIISYHYPFLSFLSLFFPF